MKTFKRIIKIVFLIAQIFLLVQIGSLFTKSSSSLSGLSESSIIQDIMNVINGSYTNTNSSGMGVSVPDGVQAH